MSAPVTYRNGIFSLQVGHHSYKTVIVTNHTRKRYTSLQLIAKDLPKGWTDASPFYSIGGAAPLVCTFWFLHGSAHHLKLGEAWRGFRRVTPSGRDGIMCFQLVVHILQNSDNKVSVLVHAPSKACMLQCTYIPAIRGPRDGNGQRLKNTSCR